VLYLEPNLNPAVTTYGNLQTLPSWVYAFESFTFYPRYKSEKNQQVNITHNDLDYLHDGDKTKINMKHSDADHTGICSTKSPLT
jgi:hypothetical protein